MQEEMQNISKGDAQLEARVEPKPKIGMQTYMGITENTLTAFNCREGGLLEFILSPSNLNTAYKRVKSNKGSGGVDRMSVDMLLDYLTEHGQSIIRSIYDGKYKPNPVRRVEIPKSNGKKRQLGIPTVVDRVIQQAITQVLAPLYESLFSSSSYGFRPHRSAHDAIRKCGEYISNGYIFTVDMDLEKFFDTVIHSKLIEVLSRTVKDGRVISLIHKYLNAGVMLNGRMEATPLGVPQGVIGPVLANLFLHYTFDKWMEKNFPRVPFERYADDTICHCHSLKQAEYMQAMIHQRFESCRLRLNEEKTKIVYCKSSRQKECYPNVTFDFLGFTFHPRESVDKYGNRFTGFLPAISQKSMKRINETIRNWHLNRHSNLTLEHLASDINPIVRGWMTYYGKFYPTR